MRCWPVLLLTLLLILLATGCPPAQPGNASAKSGTSTEKTTSTEPQGETVAPEETTDAAGAADAEAAAEEAAAEEAAAADGTGDMETSEATGIDALPETRDAVDPTGKIGIMKTNMGDIKFFFFPDEAPKHVRNFIYLAQKGFYTDVPFHRIVPDFVIQGGEARADWNEPTVSIPLEVTAKRNHRTGSLAAARTDDVNSATSQFYFVINGDASNIKALDTMGGGYTVYGQAFDGIDTILKIGETPQNQNKAKILSVEIVEAAPYAEAIAAYKAKVGITD